MLGAIKELGYKKKVDEVIVHYDNQLAIHLANNHRITSKSKHIAIHYHAVRELIGKRLTLKHVPSANNLADICTKALPLPAFRRLTALITKGRLESSSNHR